MPHSSGSDAAHAGHTVSDILPAVPPHSGKKLRPQPDTHHLVLFRLTVKITVNNNQIGRLPVVQRVQHRVIAFAAVIVLMQLPALRGQCFHRTHHLKQYLTVRVVVRIGNHGQRQRIPGFPEFRAYRDTSILLSRITSDVSLQ